MDAAIARLLHPVWMANPDSWMWSAKPGEAVNQGFGATWRESPGLANLLWLLLDMERPPAVYNARTNADYVGLISSYCQLGPLVELASLNTLEQFSTRLRYQRQLADIGYSGFSEKLLRLADRRLRCVH